MLALFDWLRRCQSGAELIAAVEYLTREDSERAGALALSAPYSALHPPCRRCWIYAPQGNGAYCATCNAIRGRARHLHKTAVFSTLIWGHVNALPRHIQAREGFADTRPRALYVHDDHRFLLILDKRDLKPWLQELALYHGLDLTGFIQIFPTVGGTQGATMGDLLCRVVHRDAHFPLDRLRVRFYAAPYHVIKPFIREQEGLLTFSTSDFLSLLEMATVFRSVLYPNEQDMLYELLTIEDPTEEQFYWGRFLGLLNQEAKDMLHAWRIRNWSKQRIKLLYELTNYVGFRESY